MFSNMPTNPAALNTQEAMVSPYLIKQVESESSGFLG